MEGGVGAVVKTKAGQTAHGRARPPQDVRKHAGRAFVRELGHPSQSDPRRRDELFFEWHQE